MGDFITLFGFPIFKTSIDPNSWDKQGTIDTIYKNYAIDKHRNKLWDTDVHIPYGDEANPKFKDLNADMLENLYRPIADTYFKNYIPVTEDFDYNLYYVNYTAMGKGQEIPSHYHPHHEFYCIHYINFKEGHTSTRYHNPLPCGSHYELMTKKRSIIDKRYPSNSYLSEYFHLDIKEDDFVIAPSVLFHSVPKHNLDELRMTIASNIWIN